MNEVNLSPLLLDERLLTILEQVRILSKKQVRNLRSGEQPSRRSGGSMEFLEYRNYQPGDDPRYVDWNVYGRMNRLYIKLFQAEKERPVYILLDSSKSMEFGNPEKLFLARQIAAATSYISLANQDRVGLVTFDHGLREFRLPEKGRRVYLSLVNLLNEVKPDGETDINTVLLDFLTRVNRPSLVIAISDFLDPSGFKQGLKACSYGKHEVVLIQVLDREEVSPKTDGYVRMGDVETGKARSFFIDQRLRDAYTASFNRFITTLRSFCLERGFDYFMVNTDTPVEEVLISLFTKGSIRA